MTTKEKILETALELFSQRGYGGVSVREIARECGVGEEKVKSALFRTRNKLRQAMEEEGTHV